jgi:hypothetical protein
VPGGEAGCDQPAERVADDRRLLNAVQVEPARDELDVLVEAEGRALVGVPEAG